MKKIMVVDDEEDTRLSVKSALEDYGFDVETVADGKDCLSKLKKYKADLILLDIMMPGLTSEQIIAKIRRNKETAKIKIIFLTVIRQAEMNQKNLLKGNIVDFIEKPFSNEDLVKRVKKALGIVN